MVERTCEHCLRTFAVHAATIRQAPHKRWCSWDCRKAAGWNASPGVAIAYSNCKLCDRLFVHPKKRKRTYCSADCTTIGRGLARRGERIENACGWCGRVVIRTPATQQQYCSRRCAGYGRPIDGRPSKIADESIRCWAEREARPLYVTELRVSRWSIDLAFPLLMLAVELDGEYWHSLPGMVAKDLRKDAGLAAKGWKVEHVVIKKEDTPVDVADRIDETVGLPRFRRRRSST